MDFNDENQSQISLGSDIKDSNVFELADVIKTNTSLKSLNLFHTNINDDAFISLVHALKENSSVNSLTFYHLTISSKVVIELVKVLKENTLIQDLSFSGINIDTIVELMNAVKDNRTLKSLFLEQILFSDETVIDEKVIELTNALKENTSIKVLSFAYNNINDKGMIGFANLLKDNSNLSFLYLGFNNIDNAGVITLINGLKDNSNLKSLDLSYNNIGDEGMIALVNLLNYNSNLNLLSLKGNNINNNGVIALVDLLQVNKSLRHLGLPLSTNITKDVLKKFVDVFKVNSYLKNLEYNICSKNKDYFDSILLDVLKLNISLEYIYSSTDLSRNNSSKNISSNNSDTEKQIYNELRKNTYINQSLFSTFTNLSSKDFNKLFNQLQKNFDTLESIDKNKVEYFTIDYRQKSLNINNEIYYFEGECPYFKYNIFVEEPVIISKKSSNNQDVLPNDNNIDYLEYISEVIGGRLPINEIYKILQKKIELEGTAQVEIREPEHFQPHIFEKNFKGKDILNKLKTIQLLNDVHQIRDVVKDTNLSIRKYRFF